MPCTFLRLLVCICPQNQTLIGKSKTAFQATHTYIIHRRRNTDAKKKKKYHQLNENRISPKKQPIYRFRYLITPPRYGTWPRALFSSSQKSTKKFATANATWEPRTMCGGFRELIAQELFRLGFCVDMQDLKVLYIPSMGRKHTRRRKLSTYCMQGHKCRRMKRGVVYPR